MKSTPLIAAASAVILASCASIPGVEPPAHGYLWEHDSSMPVCERVIWVQRPTMADTCGYEACAGPAAGIPACTVYSTYSEARAHQVSAESYLGSVAQGEESVYDHEARHILQRMKHPRRAPEQAFRNPWMAF